MPTTASPSATAPKTPVITAYNRGRPVDAVSTSSIVVTVTGARAGESLVALATALGRALDPPLPAGSINFDALRDRFGNVVVQALARLAPGEISEPVRAMDGYWVTRLIAREPDVVPPLEDVTDVVQQAWVQHEHDALLTREIEKLRKQADVSITDGTLAGAR